MTVLTENEFHTLSALASAIPEEHLKNNALALLDKMASVIEGVGDRPITWQPTFIKIIQGTTDTSNLVAGAAGKGCKQHPKTAVCSGRWRHIVRGR